MLIQTLVNKFNYMYINYLILLVTLFITSCLKESRAISDKKKLFVEDILSAKKDSGVLHTKRDSVNKTTEILISTNKNIIVCDCNILDTCINGIIIFKDGISMRKAFPNLKSAWKRNDRVYFMTKDSSKYISLGTNYGGGFDEYKNAEIGYIVGNSTTFQPEAIKDYYQSIDNSYLGRQDTSTKKDYYNPYFHFTISSYMDFKTQTGIKLGITEQDFLKLNKNRPLKRIKKREELEYLYTNEDCLYEGRYIFKKNKLEYFSFGYTTP